MNNKLILFLSLILVSLLACNKQGDESTEHPNSKTPSLPPLASMNMSDVFVYECGDSVQFTAHVREDSSWLFLPDTTLKVNRVKSGSGARYEAASHIFWKKGEEALLQLPTGGLMSCKKIPRESSWKAARVRGVDFRAVGQEADWTLEITEGEQINLSGGPGQDTIKTTVLSPQIKDNKRRVYHIQTPSHRLKVEIIDKPCRTAEDGTALPYTVTITLDGKTLQGCGRALN